MGIAHAMAKIAAAASKNKQSTSQPQATQHGGNGVKSAAKNVVKSVKRGVSGMTRGVSGARSMALRNKSIFGS